jgi:hypothetical protein
VQAEEQQQAAKRWAEKKAAAVDSSLDLSNMKPHREAIKKLKTTVNLYLERLRGKAKNQFSDEDFLLPESDHQTLIDKVKEIHSSGKAKKTDFGSKRLARTQQDIQRYLGEPLTIQLFQQLK